MKGAVEYYCDPCLAKVFEREKSYPEDKDALASHFGCMRGNWKVEEEKTIISLVI